MAFGKFQFDPARLAKSLSRRQRITSTAATLALCCLSLPGQVSSAGDAGEDAASVSGNPRVIGGSLAAADAWPSLGALLLKAAGRPPNLRQICGGTLIAPSWFLTAAHCVTRSDGSMIDAFNLSVMFGQIDLNEAAGEPETGVQSVMVHPDFELASYSNDVALLELSVPVDQPTMALYQGNVDSQAGNAAVVAGWGAFEYGGDQERSFDGRQRQAQVPVVSRQICNEPASYDGTIDTVRFCAGFARGGVDACAGDSGGPLILGIEDNGNQMQAQAGIVSYGVGCALPAKYGVYTDVAAFKPWISEFVSPLFLPRNLPVDDPITPSSASSGGGGAVSGLAGLLLLGVCLARRRHKVAGAAALAGGPTD